MRTITTTTTTTTTATTTTTTTTATTTTNRQNKHLHYFALFVVVFFCFIPKICFAQIGYFRKVKIRLNCDSKSKRVSRVRHPQSVFLTLAFFMSVCVSVDFYGQIKSSLIVEMERNVVKMSQKWAPSSIPLSNPNRSLIYFVLLLSNKTRKRAKKK